MTGPYKAEFWQEFNQMMQNTMENMQKMLNKVGTNTGGFVNENNEHKQDFYSNWFQGKKPDISVNQDKVVVTVYLDKEVYLNNIQIHLEGNTLMIDGAIQDRIPLPVAVQKYGGRAIVKNRTLEITLGRDKYTVKQHIPIEYE